jgi:CheY-like chemotaxis protein
MRDQSTMPIRILICDADERERRRTRRTLEAGRVSNSLYTVGGGDALLDFLYQRGPFAGETGAAPRPGLILLALSAASRDERDALGRIQRDPGLCQIPVAIVSASPRDEAMLRNDGLGVETFITKPVTLSRLMTAIDSLDRYWLDIVERSPTFAEAPSP